MPAIAVNKRVDPSDLLMKPNCNLVCWVRLFNVIDNFTRQCIAIIVDVSINGQRVARELTRLIDLYGRPEFIVCDNGTEYTSLVMFDWAQRSGVGLQFIQPGKPS